MKDFHWPLVQELKKFCKENKGTKLRVTTDVRNEKIYEYEPKWDVEYPVYFLEIMDKENKQLCNNVWELCSNLKEVCGVIENDTDRWIISFTPKS